LSFFSAAGRQKIVLRFSLALFIFLIGGLDACSAESPRTDNSGSGTVPVTTIQKGNFSGVRAPLQIVVRTPAEWESLWKRHASTQSPPSPAPVIDFRAEMVAGVFLGEKSTGGYEVEITKAELKDGSLVIYYLEKNPGSGGAAIQAITQPFHLVKLPKTDAPVVFSRLTP
jgi:PrcB C-terminal